MAKKILPKVYIALWMVLLVGLGIYYAGFAPRDAEFTETENRTLAAFPEVSAESLFSGRFSQEIETYLLDRFPLRDEAISSVNRFQSLVSFASHDEYLLIAEDVKDPLVSDDYQDLLDDLLNQTEPKATAPTTEATEPTHDPADRPGQPDADASQSGGEHKGQPHPQDQIRKGRDHKFLHASAAPQDTVGDQLYRYDEVKRCHDPKECDTRIHGICGAVLQENLHQGASEEEIGRHKGDAQHPDHFDPGFVALPYPFVLSGSQILCRVIGNAVAQGCKGCDHQIVQLDRAGVSRHHAGAEAVDNALQNHVANGNKALLQHTRNRDPGDALKHSPGKQRYFIRLNPRKAAQNHQYGQNTADALADQRGPCHTGDAHVKGNELNIKEVEVI